MDKNLILEILNGLETSGKRYTSGKERKEYLKNCLSLLKSDVIISIIGISRAEKSYLMRQIAKNLISSRVKSRNILIISFEDNRFTEFYPKILQKFMRHILNFLIHRGNHLFF